MLWHPRFEDFARYSLLDADKTEAARSRKEAFCLANTDSVDLTVPDADWRPENTDLATSCGDYTSLSIREVLVSGWGDTYTQYRAGQSFRVKDLPNGVYYVAVVANPAHRLVESSLDNNVSLRKIRLSHRAAGRSHHRRGVRRPGLRPSGLSAAITREAHRGSTYGVCPAGTLGS